MLTKQEINRKLIHLIALLMPLGIFYLPKITALSIWAPPFILAVVFTLSVLLEWARFKSPEMGRLYLKCFHFALRKNEEKKTTGATFIIGGALICSVVFAHAPHISFTMLTLFILGDGMAALVGLGLGRIKLLGKTLEGSLACFGLCVFLLRFIFPHMPFLAEDWGIVFSWSFVLTTSFLITFFEFVPIKITKTFTLNDNLYVPVITGLLISGLLSLNVFN